MTIKDYVYLGLILLAALAFYCNGFYAGVYRCKRMYDTLIADPTEPPPPNASAQPPVEIPQGGNSLSESDKVFTNAQPNRDVKILFSSRDLRGDFGKN